MVGFRPLLVTLAVTAPIHAGAFAEPVSSEERTLAEALFVEGKALADQGRFSEACPKLAESHRIDPGAGVLLNLAICHEGEGRLAAAWGEFREARALSNTEGRQDRVDLATEHIVALEPRLSFVAISLEGGLPVGATLSVDGAPFPMTLVGTETPLDPGTHVIDVAAAGHRSTQITFEVGAPGLTKSVRIPPLESLPTLSPGTLTTTGAVLSVAGGVGLAVGVGAAIVAATKLSESDEECAFGCTSEGVTLSEEALAAATVSTVGFVAGGFLAAGGITFLSVGAVMADGDATLLLVGTGVSLTVGF